MAITFKWFNKEGISGGIFLVNIMDGVTYTDNFNEELDSATVILEYQEKLAFEPFDLVEITFPILGTKTMIIDDFVEDEIDLDNHIYKYTINLMSKTKELERVPLPSTSVTKPKNSNAKTVREVLTNFLTDYSPLYYDSTQTLQRKYDLTLNGLNEYCPDMQMTRPTLREAFDRVLSSQNKICVLDANNTVNWLDLNSRGNEIKFDKYYNYKPENQSSNDYATDLENNYNNVVPNELSSVKNDTTITKYIGFRSEQMIVDDNNAEIILDNPIYDLKEVKWCGVMGFDNVASAPLGLFTVDVYTTNGIVMNQPVQSLSRKYYFEIDITKYIIEEQEYNILTYDEQKKYAYYTRGDNKIKGLLKYKKGFLENYITLENMIYNVLKTGNIPIIQDSDFYIDIKNELGISDIEGLSPGYVDGVTVNFEPDLFDNDNYRTQSTFKITYEAQNENIRTQSSKYLKERNQDNIIVDNPSEAFVDIKRQGELFNQKCNRLGNRVKYINARFPVDYPHLPQLSDYIDNKVLIRREFQFYDDYILFKGTLTENYVNINYFTGINARKRSWNIISASEAFDKELLEKWYCELSFDDIETKDERVPMGDSDEGYYWNLTAYNLINVFSESTPTTTLVTHAWLRTPNMSQYDFYTGRAKAELDLTSYIIGNSLVFNFKTDDNYSLGIYVNNPNATGGMRERYIKYTDDNGFCNSFYVNLVNDYQPGGIPQQQESFVSESEQGYLNFLATTYYKPLTPTNYSVSRYVTTFNNHKDSREKLGFNIQFEFCSDNPNIVIGPALLTRQRLIRITNIAACNVYKSNHIFKVTDKTLPSDATLLPNTTLSVYGEACKAYLDIENYTDELVNDYQDAYNRDKSIIITDSATNEIILAFNIHNDSESIGSWKLGTKYIYLYMLKIRDRNRYLNKDLKTWQ